MTNEVFFEELKEERLLIRNLKFTSALYKKLFMNEKKISWFFLLLVFQTLVSCAVTDSKNKIDIPSKKPVQPFKNVEKHEGVCSWKQV